MNTYHLKDKPVIATQWNGNIRVFKNALQMMLKTEAIALQPVGDKVYVACEAFIGHLDLNDYLFIFNGGTQLYVRTKDEFEERYEL